MRSESIDFPTPPEADAEGMEHHVSKSMLKAFERFLAAQS
jgi:hypothetical protein